MILSESTRLCSAIDGEGVKILADKIAQLEETIETSWEKVAKLEEKNDELQHDLNGAKGAILNYRGVVEYYESQKAALKENRDRWHQRCSVAYDILDTTQRKQYEEELDALTGGADWFCPACDAGVGHCNGPHKGSDEIAF